MLTIKTSERGPAPGAGSLVQTCSGRKTAGDRFFKRKKSTWKQVLNEATEKAIEAFQAKYEGVTVSPEYGAWSGWEEKQSLNILGGNSADLMQINWNWIDLYSNNGTNFADLNQYADIIDLSQFPESALEIRLPQSHWL